MASSMDQLAARIAGLERQLAAARTPQLAHSSVTMSDGSDVGVIAGLEAGFKSGAISQQALAAADDAYQAAHNIGPDQLLDGAVTFGKVAAGAIGTLALKADAIDGKVINGVTITGGRLQTDTAGQRIVLRPGAGLGTYGNGVIEMFSGVAGETKPAILMPIVDGAGATANASLYLMSPEKEGAGGRSFIQLFAQDADSYSRAAVVGQVAQIEGQQFVNILAPASFMKGQNQLTLGAGPDVAGLPTTRMNLFADRIETFVDNASAMLITTAGVALGANGSPVAGMVFGQASYTCNTSGVVDIPHSLGVTPTTVLLTPQGTLSYEVVLISKASTTIRVQYVSASSRAPVTSALSLPVNWMALA